VENLHLGFVERDGMRAVMVLSILGMLAWSGAAQAAIVDPNAVVLLLKPIQQGAGAVTASGLAIVNIAASEALGAASFAQVYTDGARVLANSIGLQEQGDLAACPAFASLPRAQIPEHVSATNPDLPDYGSFANGLVLKASVDPSGLANREVSCRQAQLTSITLPPL